MSGSCLVLNYDYCYVTNDFNRNKYLGLVVIDENGYWIWEKNTYLLFLGSKISNINIWKIHWTNHNNIEKQIAPDTEILINTCWGEYNKIILPTGLKIYCNIYLSDSIININFPIGLKYLCLNEHYDPNLIKKIKIPFGCKIVLFNIF